MMLFSHSLLRPKNWRVSKNSCKGFIESLITIVFLETHVCINKPCWQSSGITIISWKYWNRLLGVFFWLVTVIVSELHENPRKKKLNYRKKYIEVFVWGISLFGCTPSFWCLFFVAFLVYSLTFYYSDFT